MSAPVADSDRTGPACRASRATDVKIGITGPVGVGTARNPGYSGAWAKKRVETIHCSSSLSYDDPPCSDRLSVHPSEEFDDFHVGTVLVTSYNVNYFQVTLGVRQPAGVGGGPTVSPTADQTGARDRSR